MGFKKGLKINYGTNGDYLEVKLKNGNETLDTQQFDIKNEKGQRSFFNYVIDKLGINFKKYQREKDSDYI